MYIIWMVDSSWYTQDANGTIIHPAGTNWTDVADLNFEALVAKKS